MMVTKLTVYHTHEEITGYKKNSESFTCDPSKINTSIGSDTAVSLINWAENYVNLTDDTYEYSQIVSEQGINEILAN